jgi:prepilin-type N-terminal cleavage/methylation domain-containing protein
MKNPKRPKGFTLVELLVVIVIIAALASVAFVAGRSVLMSSRASKTVSNLKEIGTAVHGIKEDGLRGNIFNPGVFPPYGGFLTHPHVKFNILELVGEYMGYCEEKPPGYTWKVMPSETPLRNPLSKRVLGGTAKKPSEVSLSTKVDQCYGSYSYNAWIEGFWNLWVPITPNNTPHLTRVGGVNRQGREIMNPAMTVLMGETWDKASSPLWTGWENTTPQGNYKDGAHCVFVDNHVQRIPNSVLRSEAGLKKYLQTTWRR